MIRVVCFLLLTTVSMASVAENDEQVRQEIEQLKLRIEQLEAEAGSADEQKEAAPAEKPVNTAPAKVYTRYWLSKNQTFDEKSEPPMLEGLMSLDAEIKLNPKKYGYKSRWFFDKHKDPSLYPVAAISIEGELDIKQSGKYQLTVKPTPPREVGGAGNVEISIEITIDGKMVFSMPFSKRLASQLKEVQIRSGRQPFQIKILARSPGFGPSPTKAAVYIGLQSEEEITSQPINTYLAIGK